MSKYKTASTDLACLTCGNIATIQRRTAKQREVSHIKDLWCYKCMKTTKHYEVRDVDIFLHDESFDKEKIKVKELIRNARNKRF